MVAAANRGQAKGLDRAAPAGWTECMGACRLRGQIAVRWLLTYRSLHSAEGGHELEHFEFRHLERSAPKTERACHFKPGDFTHNCPHRAWPDWRVFEFISVWHLWEMIQRKRKLTGNAFQNSPTKSRINGAKPPLKRRSSTARYIQPMLLQFVSKLPQGEHWQYEVKWDGNRGLAVIQPEPSPRFPVGRHLFPASL